MLCLQASENIGTTHDLLIIREIDLVNEAPILIAGATLLTSCTELKGLFDVYFDRFSRSVKSRQRFLP